MIRLVRRRAPKAVPADFRGEKLIDKHVDLVDRYYTAKETAKPIKFSSSKWKSAKSKLKVDSSEKCAYCDAPTALVAHGDVEHFRPKSQYWWLAYTFDNFLFSCQLCNQVFKNDNFPVGAQGALVAPHMPPARPATGDEVRDLAKHLVIDASLTDDEACIASWSAENAHLVHPYLEDPELFFLYQADVINREVWVRPAVGQRSQDVYAASSSYLGINREELRKARYIAYATLAIIRGSYLSDDLSANTKQDIIQHFDQVRLANYPFCGMHRYFLREWGF